MRRWVCPVFLALTIGVAHAQQTQTPQQGASVSAPIVFFDIAGPDSAALTKFYRDAFGWSIGPMGNISVTVGSTPQLKGTIRKDPAEKVLYIGVPDVTAALAKVTAAGGSINAPRFEVKGVVILGLFSDPAGNRMGLVEMADGNAKIP